MKISNWLEEYIKDALTIEILRQEDFIKHDIEFYKEQSIEFIESLEEPNLFNNTNVSYILYHLEYDLHSYINNAAPSNISYKEDLIDKLNEVEKLAKFIEKEKIYGKIGNFI